MVVTSLSPACVVRSMIQSFPLLLALALFQCLHVLAQESAEIVAFEFPGALSLALGSPPQSVRLLPTFYTYLATTLLVPTGSTCHSTGGTSSTGDWNPITEPREGSNLVTGDGDQGVLGGSVVVHWRPSSDVKSLNISLRKGRGEDARNVSLIESDIINDGEYPWNANSTYARAGLGPGEDYSLMLWTENPPQQSVSGFFSMGPRNVTGNDTTPVDTARYAACLQALKKNGYYNETLDGVFVAGATLGDGIGTTSAFWDTQRPAQGFSLTGLPVNVAYESATGYGMVSLSSLQRARNSRVSEMDIVSLYLGTDGVNGSVVMGGFDEGLIDHSQKAVFSKANVNSEEFAVAVTSVQYVSKGKETGVYESTKGTDAALSYNSFGIRLTSDMLNSLLPLIGNPSYDKAVDGYVYSSTPPADYSLRFTMGNGSSTVTVDVPASSIITTDPTDDNPLSSQKESGRTYLRISPAPPTDGPSLGRSFLQHVYLINAPPTINKFHLSAIPSPRRKQILTPASRTSIAIFQSGPQPTRRKDNPGLGPMLGGILGGITLLLVTTTAYVMFQRRNQRSSSRSSRLTVRFADSSSFEKPSLQARSLANQSVFDKEVFPSHQIPTRSTSAPLTRPTRKPSPIMRKSASQQSMREESRPPRTATLGKFYTGAGVVGSPSPPPRALVRTASVGRVVVSPVPVDFSPVTSRRSSVRTSLGMVQSPMREEGVPEEGEEGEEGGVGRSSRDTDESSVFGLSAVMKDGEFLKGGRSKSGGYVEVGDGDGGSRR